MIDPGLIGRVVLVTGANSGIGAATARAFAAQGATLVLHYLDRQPPLADASIRIEHEVPGAPAAEALAREIVASGGRAVPVAADLSDPAAAVHLFDAAEAQAGPVEVLVNNAAHCESPDTILQITAGTLDRHFAVNTRAPVLLTHEYARRHQRRGGTRGRIIHLSTDAARAFATQIAYGASKAALEAFTRSTAVELGPLGITVNAVAPGPVQTGWITPELEEQVLPWIPLRRVGTPEDVADAIVFLASDQARWITGQVLQVAGGHAL
ncbi:MAG TPA: SDR family oxidoreductase [Longimicrobiaceae bacterium]|nr:SDR family oxidoreductase [Longimicrobiaceae bacterium]